MEEDKFERRLVRLQTSFGASYISYGFTNEDEVWRNIGSHPVDKLLTILAELYIESNNHQRQRLYTYCGTEPKILENFWYFIRRIGRLIHSKENKSWLEIGLASALLDGGRSDFRDLIVSLVLLRFVAERREIEVKPIFDSFIQSADGNIKGILENVRDHPESSIHMTVQDFGHPEWSADSVRIFGEYNMHTFANRLKEELAQENQLKQSKAQAKKTFRKRIIDFFKGQ